MVTRKITFFIFLFISVNIHAQDTVSARRLIDTLTSSAFYGRGYINDGLFKSMQFLVSRFTSIGLKPMNVKSYIQPLSYPVNTFPGGMSVKINGKDLRPGFDFIISPESNGISGEFQLEKLDSAHYVNKEARLYVSLEQKLTWGVSTLESDSTVVKVNVHSFSAVPKTIILNIEQRLNPNYKTGNVCGFVKGKSKPDSMILFTAHYDHLGGMGKDVFFPGANDNASGITLLLGLAEWYAKNPQRYSVGFICFTGEEAGLLGSEFFVKHPLVSLKNIRFLINLDIMGTGVEGIMVVNATKFEKEYALLKSINEKKNLLVSVNARGKAKNSDHYWFTEKGVRSFFIYTLGGIKAYHDVYDVSATLPNNEYKDLFLLFREFVNSLM